MTSSVQICSFAALEKRPWSDLTAAAAASATAAAVHIIFVHHHIWLKPVEPFGFRTSPQDHVAPHPHLLPFLKNGWLMPTDSFSLSAYVLSFQPTPLISVSLSSYLDPPFGTSLQVVSF